ncbi:MAG: ATP-binding protein, partial [Chloroflexi bacterium]|nr:ATP-binding protein [Chloroflexota bacterium]
EVSFKALKEVFLGDDFTRTRPYRRSEEPFDHVEAARQQGPTIVQSFHENMTRRGGYLNRILCDVVAFANTNGGTIYVGVSSQARVPPKGVDNPEEAMATLRAEIERAVTPPIPVELSVLKSRGKNVIRIAVPKGEEVPYVLDGSHVYVRRESETSLALRDEIVALVARARARAAAQEAPSPEKEAASAEEEAAPAQTSETPPGVVEAPRTGVEIDETVVRKGVKYHTVRDLRDGTKVHNVTRASARRLWRYAIALKEKGAFQEDKVK